VGKLRFGCCGWSYDEWVGPLYRTASESKLAAYARVFDTAEIDSTFYRPPTKGIVLGWARYTPSDFKFAAKVPQTVTHDRLLDLDLGAGKELLDFCDLMRPLLDAGKLGPLLLQLPPRLRFEPTKLRKFFGALPPEFTWSVEPRNKTWMVEEAFDLLAAHGLAYTIVDEPLLPPVLRVTAKTAYIRWHGQGKDPWYDYRYSEEEISAWVPKVREVAAKAEEVYGFWNNHYHGYAPENGLQALEMLGVPLTPLQQGAARRIREFRKGLVRTSAGVVKTTTLESFAEAPPPGDAEVLRLLASFLDRGRLDRARRMATEAVEVLSESPVEARIHEYGIVVDAANRRVVHDCEDFAKSMRDGRFCKHLGRLFLSLPPDRAAPLLRAIAGDRDSWTFTAPEA
jgi:uncharacterized protein YecE (DUF72 family)